ncbi:MAG: hypothetical protein JWO31_1170 [Phycisphaerales bacterium]|nr:hypothetical protein [Phycisphaerales bacterium]
MTPMPEATPMSAAPPSAKPLSFLGLLALLAGPLVGCARYEYDVVAPSEFAQHVGTKAWGSAVREPLEYKFITVEDRLVVQVYNRSADAVRLLGDRSVVVDPRGQSHPVRPQTIAPGSFVKIVLPPLPPRLERTGPSIGFGVGLGFGSAGYRGRGASGGLGYDGPGYDGPLGSGLDEPRYYAVVDPSDTAIWTWDGEGKVRLTLVYDIGGGKNATHEFRLGRKKA